MCTHQQILPGIPWSFKGVGWTGLISIYFCGMSTLFQKYIYIVEYIGEYLYGSQAIYIYIFIYTHTHIPFHFSLQLHLPKGLSVKKSIAGACECKAIGGDIVLEDVPS